VNKKIGFITPVCEEDAVRWGAQYLEEITRLGFPFAMHFTDGNRLTSDAGKEAHNRFRHHPLYVGASIGPKDRSFRDHDRQGAYDILERKRFDATILMDIDETWEANFHSKIEALFQRDDWDAGRVHWINVWERPDQLRIDNPSNPYRVKINRLDQGKRWHWMGWSVDPYIMPERPRSRDLGTDLVCLHWGLMTRELRLFHRDRNHQLFKESYGECPFEYWDYLLDEKRRMELITNTFLPKGMKYARS
jgi:hypothetical protein